MDEVEKLIQQLKDPDPTSRWKAAWELGDIGDARAVEPLVGALKDDDYDVRSHAASALVALASYTDIDLSKVADSLQAYEKTVKKTGDERGYLKARKWALNTYLKIAKAVSERKKKEMPGILSTGKIKPPKKGMYRTGIRRAVNG